jgi:hypothetical protein
MPAEPRTPRAGRLGGASCRDVAIITGPPVQRAEARGCGLERGQSVGAASDGTSGKRHAMKAGRRVPVARLTAQGRVGHRSRHVASHLALLPLLSARMSALPDADSHSCIIPCRFAPGDARPIRQVSMRSVAQPHQCRSPGDRAGGAKLSPTAGVATAPRRGELRGKGVLAA